MSQITDMVQKQLQHRTIREFKDTAVPKDIFDTLMEVARRTATSNGMQSYSIIRVTDAAIKKEIAEEKGAATENAADMDRFFQGFTDACLAVQNVVNAAEAMGFGAVYLGSILNDTARICQILKLPRLTFPVLGLGIGYPNQSPQLKPRFGNTLRVFENRYRVFDSYLDEIKDYDQEMTTYYDLRDASRRVDCFSDQVVAKLSASMPNRRGMLKVARQQGFAVEI